MPSKLLKTIAYYAAGFFQGTCLVTFPAASMIFKSPQANAITDAQYGLAFIAQIAAAIAASVLMAPLLKRFSEKQVFLAGLLSNLLCLVFLWLTIHFHGKPNETFWLLCMANAFLGAGFGLTISTMNLCVVELHPHHKDAALAGLHGILGIGAALAPLSVNYFHERGDWAGSLFFGFALGIGLIILASFFQLVSSAVGTSPEGASKTKTPKLNLAIYAFLAVLVVYGTVESILGNWTLTFVNREKALPLAAASMSLSLFWIFLTVGRLITSLLSMKIKSEWIYLAAPVMMLLSLGALSFAQTEQTVWMSYVFIGLGCSSVFPLTLGLSIARFPQHKEVLSSLTLTSLMIGVGLGSSGAGFLQSANILDLKQIFIGTSICAAIIFPAMILLSRIPVVLEDHE